MSHNSGRHKRTSTLTRLFKGLTAADDHVPAHVTKPHVWGMFARVRLDETETATAVRRNYDDRGWDQQGLPTRSTLQCLGMAILASWPTGELGALSQ